MDKLHGHLGIGVNTSRDRGRIGNAMLVLLLLLVFAAGCQTGTADSDTVAAAEVAAQPQPSVTPEPPPTATPEAASEPVTIPYMDPETETDIATLSRWLKIYRPTAATAPYPTVFLLPGRAYLPDGYAGLVEQLLDRGYAVIGVKGRTADSRDPYRSPGCEDFDCAFAWLMANGVDYELDSEHIYILGHTTGGMAAIMEPLQTEAIWMRTLTDCPHPIPDAAAISGVITYDAFTGVPNGVIGHYPGHFGPFVGISGSDVLAVVEVLSSVPPREWRNSSLLDENARKLAEMLPPYWLYTDDEARATPPYLLIYDSERDTGGGFDWVTESETMADLMRDAGIDVTTMLIENAAYTGLVDDQSDVPAQVAEAVDAFITEHTQ